MLTSDPTNFNYDALDQPTQSSSQSETPQKPNNSPAANIYSAVYSGVPVYEMMCRNVAVMRRRSDSYLNATQILKVAGIDKGRRTKILEKEILNGEHEKVQGGYGKYQGTWIPYERGVQLAQHYNVDKSLQSILEFEPPPAGKKPIVMKKEQYIKQFGTKNEESERKQKRSSHHEARKKQKTIPAIDNVTTCFEMSTEPLNPERHRATLMAIFLNEDPSFVPDILTSPNPPFDLDIDLVIDEHGHTCLHWAAAMGRLSILNILVNKGADLTKRNQHGETALMRSVLVCTNFDYQTFQQVVEKLDYSIPLVDKKHRTVLHHIALSAGFKGRQTAARYYLECVLERIAKTNGDFQSIVDVQDRNGDTALNIASRIGNKSLIEQLLEVGADPNIENRAGLRPCDFGIDAFSCIQNLAMGDQYESSTEVLHHDAPQVLDSFDSMDFFKPCSSQKTQQKPIEKNQGPKVIFPTIRTEKELPEEPLRPEITGNVSDAFQRQVKDMVETMQLKMDELYKQFTAELLNKEETLIEAQRNLKDMTRELAHLRRANALLKEQNNNIPDMIQRIQNLELYLTQEMAKNAIMMLDETPALPEYTTSGDVNQEISHLNQLIHSHMQVEQSLREQIVSLKGQVGENELKFKKIISACAAVPMESVDELIDSLLVAIQSDQNVVNVSELAGFMTRVKQCEES